MNAYACPIGAARMRLERGSPSWAQAPGLLGTGEGVAPHRLRLLCSRGRNSCDLAGVGRQLRVVLADRSQRLNDGGRGVGFERPVLRVLTDELVDVPARADREQRE